VIEGRLVIPAWCLAPYTTHHLFHLWLLSVRELGHTLAKKPNSTRACVKEKQKKNKRKTKEKQKKNKRKTKEEKKKRKEKKEKQRKNKRKRKKKKTRWKKRYEKWKQNKINVNILKRASLGFRLTFVSFL
jgi:hypothetical protein